MLDLYGRKKRQEIETLPPEFDSSSYLERTQRNHHWIGGIENQQRLRNLHVAIAGAGCFGSGVALQLARAGVGHIRIADADIVEPSNINRQVIAPSDTVGAPKVQACAALLRSVRHRCYHRRL